MQDRLSLESLKMHMPSTIANNQDSYRLADPARSRDWLFIAGVTGIIVIAFLMRLYRIGQQEVWMDEAASFQKAITPNWLSNTALNENTPPLYYLLLRVWLGIAGWSEASLRFPSAVFGTLFVLVIIWVGREFFNRQVGLWSGFCAAINPIHIYYSQEARAYALLALALALTFATLWCALKSNKWWSWLLVSACTLSAFYSHYSAILGLLPTAALVLIWPEKTGRGQRWLWYGGALLLSALLFLPWVLGSFVLGEHQWGIEWKSWVWKMTPPILAIPKTMEVFGLGSQAGLLQIPLKQYTDLDFPLALRFLGLATLLGLGLWVAGPWNEQALSIPWLKRKKVCVGALLFTPLLLLWAISFYKPMYIPGRYDFVAFPAFPLLLGLAMAKLQIATKAVRVPSLLVSLALFIPLGAKLVLYYEAPSPRPTQRIAEQIDTLVDNTDVVIFSNFRELPVIYYLNRLGYRWGEGYCQKETSHRRFACLELPRHIEKANLRGILSKLTPSQSALWVVYGHFEGSSGQILISKSDNQLFAELKRAGFIHSHFHGQPGILEFRPRSG